MVNQIIAISINFHKNISVYSPYVCNNILIKAQYFLPIYTTPSWSIPTCNFDYILFISYMIIKKLQSFPNLESYGLNLEQSSPMCWQAKHCKQWGVLGSLVHDSKLCKMGSIHGLTTNFSSTWENQVHYWKMNSK